LGPPARLSEQQLIPCSSNEFGEEVKFMNWKRFLPLLSIAVIAIVALSVFAQSQRPKRQVWEYKTVYNRTTGFEGDKTLNELGLAGWELVAAYGSSDTSVVVYTFKRAI
jgi:hypothetical protein